MKHTRKSRLFVLIIIFVFLTGIFSTYTPKAESVPAAPIVLTHVLSDGKVVFYRLMGDEFLGFSIDANGDLVAFGKDGALYYANWASESDFWENSRPLLVVATDRKPTGEPSNTSPPEYDDMPPLRSPIPKYIVEYTMKIRESSFNTEIPAIITVTLPNGVIGTSYNKTLNALGIAPISWELDSGSLPDGLSLSSSGVISGTLISADTYNFSVKATNTTGHDTQALSIRVTLFDEKDEKKRQGERSNGGGCNITAGYVLIMLTTLPSICKNILRRG